MNHRQGLSTTMSFPIDTSSYAPLSFDPASPSLSPEEAERLSANIQTVRDTIVFFTVIAGIRGFGGHTGGAYSMVPEVLIADAFMRGSNDVYPSFFDEAGHRVAIQYAMSAFNGKIPMEKLLHHREAGLHLYGHPERDPSIGVTFASGRLGHMGPFVNGIARANPGKAVFLFSSDGSQQEGNDAEAARFAVAQGLNVKLIVDDNNVTIAGHPRDYLPGYDIAKTLEGHGMTVDTGQGEDLESLYKRMHAALAHKGPYALVNRRPMAPGIPGIEGSNAGHDVISKDYALQYLEARGHSEAIDYLNKIEPSKPKATYLGSTQDVGSNRNEFGLAINGILDRMAPEERASSLFVVDSDLEGSTGIKAIHAEHPDVFALGGVMERGNFSAAAGFGYEEGKQGIFSTFSAFLEMIISESTMARLNRSDLLCHFSHAGVDEIADNTSHYGVNVFLANNGLPVGDTTRLYFPADALQLRAVVERIFSDKGIRYVFSTRSKVPFICKENGSRFYEEGYTFEPEKDEIIREGSAGYVVSYGELLYRALDAVDRARADGLDVGLVNKPTLNVVDEAAMAKTGGAPFALVVEGQNENTGLGVRYGSWLLARGHAPKYAYMGVDKLGEGGIHEHIPHQGLTPDHILAKIRDLSG